MTNDCLHCDCWDEEREGCTMPSCDMSYACPLTAVLPRRNTRKCEMVEPLYLVANEGCDDTTLGIVRISDEAFPKFKEFIENLNRNSTCRCMPIIEVFKAKDGAFMEIEYNPDLSIGDDDYIEPRYIFYLDGKTYTFSNEWDRYDFRDWEQVI